MLRILDIDGKGDDPESLHNRAQGTGERTSIETEAVEETGCLFVLTAKEEKKILVSAPGKKTPAIIKCELVTLGICTAKQALTSATQMPI